MAGFLFIANRIDDCLEAHFLHHLEDTLNHYQYGISSAYHPEWSAVVKLAFAVVGIGCHLPSKGMQAMSLNIRNKEETSTTAATVSISSIAHTRLLVGLLIALQWGISRLQMTSRQCCWKDQPKVLRHCCAWHLTEFFIYMLHVAFRVLFGVECGSCYD